jgi:hypothetical protein
MERAWIHVYTKKEARTSLHHVRSMGRRMYFGSDCAYIWYVMNTRIYIVLYSYYMFWCNIASQYIPTQPRLYFLLWVINYKNGTKYNID